MKRNRTSRTKRPSSLSTGGKARDERTVSVIKDREFFRVCDSPTSLGSVTRRDSPILQRPRIRVSKSFGTDPRVGSLPVGSWFLVFLTPPLTPFLKVSRTKSTRFFLLHSKRNHFSTLYRFLCRSGFHEDPSHRLPLTRPTPLLSEVQDDVLDPPPHQVSVRPRPSPTSVDEVAPSLGPLHPGSPFRRTCARRNHHGLP